MEIQEVEDFSGRVHSVDISTRQLMDYSNKIYYIQYRAKQVKDGRRTPYWVEYWEKGRIATIDTAISMQYSPLSVAYKLVLNFQACRVDKDKHFYKRLVQEVKENENVYFTKLLDWRKDALKKLLAKGKELRLE